MHCMWLEIRPGIKYGREYHIYKTIATFKKAIAMPVLYSNPYFQSKPPIRIVANFGSLPYRIVRVICQVQFPIIIFNIGTCSSLSYIYAVGVRSSKGASQRSLPLWPVPDVMADIEHNKGGGQKAV